MYCHNPETINRCSGCGECVDVCPAGALSRGYNIVDWQPDKCIGCDACLKACRFKSSPKAVLMTVSDIMKTVKRVKPFISGVTVSGGECTLQQEFLIELFGEIHKLGLTAFVDTNGCIDFSEALELTAAMDGAMLDIKSFDEAEHIKLTGMSNKVVIKNAEYLASKNKLYEVRTVIVPGLLDNKRNVDKISRLIASLNPDIRYKLIKYRPIGVIESMKNVPVPTDEEMTELKELAAGNGCMDILTV
jgi:YjjW family glycine radical enzyme activase